MHRSAPEFRPFRIHLLTVTDTRSPAEDGSGNYLAEALQAAGHVLHARDWCRDERYDIRAIVSASEAEKALDLLSDDFEPITSDWKLRYQMNLDLLKKGSINDIATIVRCLYNRSKVKELPILERKLYDSARKLLEDEISFATGKSLKEVETLIHIKLEPPGSAPKVKHVINIDDDEDDNLMDDMNASSNESDDGDASDEDSSYDDDSF